MTTYEISFRNAINVTVEGRTSRYRSSENTSEDDADRPIPLTPVEPKGQYPKRNAVPSYPKVTSSAPRARGKKSTLALMEDHQYDMVDAGDTHLIPFSHLEPESDPTYLSPSIQCCCHWFSAQACQHRRYQLSALSAHPAPVAQGCLHGILFR